MHGVYFTYFIVSFRFVVHVLGYKVKKDRKDQTSWHAEGKYKGLVSE